MTTRAAPRGMRLHIGLFGKRNTGKSSLLNTIAGQNIVIVSDVPGTTADPVEKAMEFPPLGPVLLIDTAGLDDNQTGIGQKRVERSLRVLDRCDLALLVSNASVWDGEDEKILAGFKERSIPAIVIFNKADEIETPPSFRKRFASENTEFLTLSAKTGAGLPELRSKIIQLAPEDFLSSAGMLGDLVHPGENVLLITPVDKEAPKGRMILPEVQAIRDVLDNAAICVVTTETQLPHALAALKCPPCLAVTDSQVFATAAALVPESIPLTSFSILLARMKGDLAGCAAGAAAISRLKDSARVLIAEACTHHPVADDIGREKLPRWIREYTGRKIEFRFVSGPDFPADPSGYDLVIQCGSCTFNRRAVLSRMLLCREHGVPFTNYGVAIAMVHGILKRALTPFPHAYEAYENEIHSV